MHYSAHGVAAYKQTSLSWEKGRNTCLSPEELMTRRRNPDGRNDRYWTKTECRELCYPTTGTVILGSPPPVTLARKEPPWFPTRCPCPELVNLKISFLVIIKLFIGDALLDAD